MANVKDDFIMEFMSACIERFTNDDLKFIKEKFWAVAYSYSMSKITSTDITVCDGTTTERLFKNWTEIPLALADGMNGE